jgi:hypothetical protein
MSRRKKETLSRRDFLKATGVMAGSVLLSACSRYIQEIPTSSLTVSPTLTKTLTPTPTETPESTATYTPTETPIPLIELPFTQDANNQIVLTPDGRARFYWEAPMSQMPTIQEIAKQLNAEPWSPDFFRKWHRFLETVSIQGAPLVKGPPADLPPVEWEYQFDKTDYQRTQLMLKTDLIYQKTHFPVIPITIIRDDKIILPEQLSFPVYIVTQMCYKSPDEPVYLRDAVFTQLYAGGSYSRFGIVGTYANFTFNYPENPSGLTGYDYDTFRALTSTLLKSGKPIIDKYLTIEGFAKNLIYDPLFEGQPNVGIRQSLMAI